MSLAESVNLEEEEEEEDENALRHLQYIREHGLQKTALDVPSDNNSCMFHAIGHALDEQLLGA